MADSSQTVISINPANWLTVLLIVGVSYFLMGAIVRTIKERKSGAAGA